MIVVKQMKLKTPSEFSISIAALQSLLTLIESSLTNTVVNGEYPFSTSLLGGAIHLYWTFLNNKEQIEIALVAAGNGCIFRSVYQFIFQGWDLE